jgi:DNA-binding NarL/FixJ family response regulator
MTIRVLVINANVLLREGIKAAVQSQSDLQIVGEAASGDDGLNQAIALRPDVAIIDVLLPDMSGMDLTRAITARSPKTHILMFSSQASPTLFQRVANAGAAGCVVHDISPADLGGAIRTIHKGSAERHRSLVTGIRRGQGLTNREIDVLRRVARGESGKEIATDLVLTESTVKNRLRSIYHKLHLRNRAQAVAYAIQNDLLAC